MTNRTSGQRKQWMIFVAVATGLAAGSVYADGNPWPARFSKVKTRNDEPRLAQSGTTSDGDDYAAAVRRISEQADDGAKRCIGRSRSARVANAAVVRENLRSHGDAQLAGAVEQVSYSRSMVSEVRNEKAGRSSDVSWDNASRMCWSPRDLCKAVKERVRYSRDILKGDEWRSGEDTWNRRAGDCDDYAVVIKELCEREGFKAEIYVFRSRVAHAAHAVTVGEKDGIMWLSSNGSYQEVKSLDDAREAIARDMGWRAQDVDVYKFEQSSGDSDRYDVRTSPQYLER